uniref:Calcineurin-like phosphoesterase domain-containing protein n=1 Tax=Meloidogyne javanica TaxID=6303 RepID=A0A915LV88_MELJA
MGGSSLWSPVFPYSTHAQRSVSSAMSELAADDQPAFIINLGDNFYMNGVKNINDERFQIEKTLGVPWFSIPGNHDYHGNIQAEIDYTNRSTRWTFPGKNANEPWYKIRYEFGAKKLKTTISLDFLMIDTVQLCGMTEDVVGDRIINWVFSESRNSNPHTPIPDKESFAGQQKDWIIGELNKYISSPSSATYVFVAGHYPIYSVGRHGSFYECLKDLDLKMKEAKISAYLSGHDHNLQHLIVENDNKILNYIVSGAGAATDRSQHHWDEFSKNQGAKVLVQLKDFIF